MKSFKLLMIIISLAAISFSVYCLIATWLLSSSTEAFVVGGLIISSEIVVLYLIIKTIKLMEINQFDIDYFGKETAAALLCRHWMLDYSGVNRYLFLKFIYTRDRLKLLGEFDENKHKRLAIILLSELLRNIGEQEAEDMLLKEAREYWTLKYPKIVRNKKFMDKVEKRLVEKR